MFAEYFLAAEKHLRFVGKVPEIRCGNQVPEERLNEVERIIGRLIPGELRSYFREMGDGYSFCPGEGEEGFMVGWLGDYKYKVAGFPTALQDDLPNPKFNKHSPEVVAQELARRER